MQASIVHPVAVLIYLCFRKEGVGVAACSVWPGLQGSCRRRRNTPALGAQGNVLLGVHAKPCQTLLDVSLQTLAHPDGKRLCVLPCL